MLDNGKSQSAAACFLRAAFVDAEEALEYALAQLGRNANTGIAHAHNGRSVGRTDNRNMRAAAFDVVANRVLGQVAHHLAQNLRVAAHDHRLIAAALNLARERHRMVLGIGTQAPAHVIGKRFERNDLVHINTQIIARRAIFPHVIEL